jgi:ATP-binding cassette subfamily B protein
VAERSLTAKNAATAVAKDPRQATQGQEKLPLGKIMRRLLAYVLASKGRLLLSLGLILASVLLSAFLPVLMSNAINIIGGQGEMADLLRVVLLIVAAAIGLWFTAWQGNRQIQRTAQDALYKLRTELFDHIQTLSLNFYDRRPIGELMSSVTNDIDTIDNFFSRSLSQAITAVLTISVTVIVMFLLNVPLTIVTLIAIPLMLGVALLLGRVAGPAFAKLQEELGDTNGFMEETLAGNKTIIAYSQQNNTSDE